MEGWTMIHKIKAMYDEGNGYSKKQISEDLSIDRKTVGKYIAMDEEEIVEYLRDPKRVKLLDEYKDYIVLQLRKYPKLKVIIHSPSHISSKKEEEWRVILT